MAASRTASGPVDIPGVGVVVVTPAMRRTIEVLAGPIHGRLIHPATRGNMESAGLIEACPGEPPAVQLTDRGRQVRAWLTGGTT